MHVVLLYMGTHLPVVWHTVSVSVQKKTVVGASLAPALGDRKGRPYPKTFSERL